MAELSKTARASMGKVKKEIHVETTEEAIKAIRDNRVAGLFIGDMSRVDKLLAAYDQEHDAVLTLGPACAGLLKRAEAAEALAAMRVPEHQHELDRMADEGCPHA